MVHSRIQSLRGSQLAWNPSTSKEGITTELVVLPTNVKNETSFEKWLPTVKEEIVLISMLQPTGRLNYNWEEFSTEGSFTKMKEERDTQTKTWRDNMKTTGYNSRTLPAVLEKAGATGIVTSNWSKGFGVNKIFSVRTEKISTVDLELEDYSMLYGLVNSGNKLPRGKPTRHLSRIMH